MITESQKTEILRQAGLLATARVRRFAVLRQCASAKESKESVDRRVNNAQSSLEHYLTQLTKEQP